MTDTDVAIVGAGPYGLAATAHLRRSGIDVRMLGQPMSFWRTMPQGMMLRSNWTATSIAEYDGPLSLDSFCAATQQRFSRPVPLDRFIDYGLWVQEQVTPDVDRRVVRSVQADPLGFRLTLSDGDELIARRVVIAAGIAPFSYLPAVAAQLPAELVSHTSAHADLSQFRNARVLIVGGGQSALESAALLHELGAEPKVVIQADHINWLKGGRYQRKLGRLAPLLYAPTDVGPMGLSRLVAVPDLFRRLPRSIQTPIAARSIRPAGAAWLVPRLKDVRVQLTTSVASLAAAGGGVQVTFADGSKASADHVLFGTGYRVDVSRYPFLAPTLLAGLRLMGGYPVLGPGLESSVPGLHFLGAPAAWSFGPTMRFVSGSWYASRALTQFVTRSSQPSDEVHPAALLMAPEESR